MSYTSNDKSDFYDDYLSYLWLYNIGYDCCYFYDSY